MAGSETSLLATRSEWPLVGRGDELEHVRSVLARGIGGIAFAGPAGVGKTRLGSEAIAIAKQAGHPTLRVGATEASSSLPFGVFATLLPDLSGVDRTEMLRRLARSITEHGDGKRVVLLVDDAHLLDEGSATLVHQLATAGHAVILATVRSTERASDAVVALWKDDLLERIDVEPMSGTDVGELLAAALGGPVDADTVRLLLDRTQGNVLFLRELVLASLEAGTLTADGGEWRMHGELPVSARLFELLEARLKGLSADEANTIDLLSIGEPLEVEIVERLSESSSLSALEERGLVRVEEGVHGLNVRFGHPLYGELVRARLSPLRTRALSRSLASALTDEEVQRQQDLLRIAKWTLAGGGEMDPHVLLAGARQASELSDYDLAEHLARAAIDAGGGFDAALFVGMVLAGRSRFEEAEGVFASLQDVAADDHQRGQLVIVRGRNLMELEGPAGAAAHLQQGEALITDAEQRTEIAAHRAFVLLFDSHFDESRAVLDGALDDATGPARSTLYFVGSLLGQLQGRFADAVRLSDDGLRNPNTVRFSSGFPPAAHRLMKVGALSLSGDLSEAERVADRWENEVQLLGDPTDRGYHAYASAGLFLRQGRVATALRWAHYAERLAPEFGPSELSVAMLIVAHVLAIAGSHADARAALDKHDELGRGVIEFDHDVGHVRGWAEASAGDVDHAVDVMLDAARTARERGCFGPELAILHDAARLGRAPDVVDRVHELDGIVDGVLAPLRATHVAALVTGDGAVLDEVSFGFERLPAFLLAAEASAHAAAAWTRAGEPRKVAASTRRASALVGRCEGASTPALGNITASAALTAREMEIARLAAAGASNKEIAGRLFLSVRTVENKLHDAYAKLGVEGRAELAGALDA